VRAEAGAALQPEPEILARHRDGATISFQLRIPADLIHFRGHFPGFPLLPGVVQVDWAILLARRCFDLPGNFQRLSALKFMRVLQPGAEVTLLLEQHAAGELRFRYQEHGQVCSSGRIFFSHGA
jgi:3-hydroxymyristoyl/3-hydroxydecanoyl-(acyl carrier protein) dehydratase